MTTPWEPELRRDGIRAYVKKTGEERNVTFVCDFSYIS